MNDHNTGTGAQDAAVYTCPMHPEVRQAGPGKCPKCGMFLVPDDTAGSHGHGHGHHGGAGH